MLRAMSVSLETYAHDPSQPLGPECSMDVEVAIANQSFLSATKLRAAQPPVFRLEVAAPDSLALGFTDGQRNKFMERVMLACNLILKQAAFSPNAAGSSRASVRVERESERASKRETNPAGNVAAVKCGVSASAFASWRACLYDNLDEDMVFDAVRKIQAVFGGNRSLTKIHHLQKCLDEYRGAMTGIDVPSAFKGLYVSLYLATNSDGVDRSESDFDSEVCRIAGCNASDAKSMRRLYNRMRHIDAGGQRAIYEKGMKDLTNRIRKLRPVAAKVILDRLA